MTIATPHTRGGRRQRDESAKVSILGDPIALIRQDHIRQLELCNQLESIADGLPHEVDIALCKRLSETMVPALRLHHSDEERALLPVLSNLPFVGDLVKPVAARLIEEHSTDEDFAEELTAALADLAELGWPENPEMLGYMLRGYFESRRRHIAWEESVLLPLADTHLTAQQRADMVEVMVANRNQAELQPV